MPNSDAHSESDSPFAALIGALSQDPQFVAVNVMIDSLEPLFKQMTDYQQQSTRRLVAKLARELDEAGMLVVPEEPRFLEDT